MDTKLTQRFAMGLTVIGTIALDTIRPLARAPNLIRYRRNRLDQWQQLGHIMAVRSGELHRVKGRLKPATMGAFKTSHFE